MRRPNYGPRGLACVAALQKRSDVFDRTTKQAGRCGECRACWRLFVHTCKQEGKPLPRAKRDGSIARFQFVKRGDNRKQSAA